MHNVTKFQKVPPYRPGQLDFAPGLASKFLFALVQCVRDQASGLAAKSLKEQTTCRTYPGQSKFERYLSKRQAGIKVYLALFWCVLYIYVAYKNMVLYICISLPASIKEACIQSLTMP